VLPTWVDQNAPAPVPPASTRGCISTAAPSTRERAVPIAHIPHVPASVGPDASVPPPPESPAAASEVAASFAPASSQPFPLQLLCLASSFLSSAVSADVEELQWTRARPATNSVAATADSFNGSRNSLGMGAHECTARTPGPESIAVRKCAWERQFLRRFTHRPARADAHRLVITTWSGWRSWIVRPLESPSLAPRENSQYLHSEM
jgi:hypothetical protein